VTKFNELLAARYNDFISALLGLQEQEGVRTVAPEMMPVMIAEGERPEHSFLKAEKKAWGGTTSPAVAAQFSLIQLLNPTGSNLIVTVEKASVGLAAAGQVRAGILFPRGTVLTNDQGNVGARDTRWLDPASISGKVAVKILTDSTAAPSIYAGGPTYRIPAGQMLELGKDVILLPGYSYLLQHTTVNVAMDGAFEWRERAVLPEENAS
jgi:hypothetical protein